MVRKCNCGNKATAEFLIKKGNTAWTIYVCSDCKPRHEYNRNVMEQIGGK